MAKKGGAMIINFIIIIAIGIIGLVAFRKLKDLPLGSASLFEETPQSQADQQTKQITDPKTQPYDTPTGAAATDYLPSQQTPQVFQDPRTIAADAINPADAAGGFAGLGTEIQNNAQVAAESGLATGAITVGATILGAVGAKKLLDKFKTKATTKVKTPNLTKSKSGIIKNTTPKTTAPKPTIKTTPKTTALKLKLPKLPKIPALSGTTSQVAKIGGTVARLGSRIFLPLAIGLSAISIATTVAEKGAKTDVGDIVGAASGLQGFGLRKLLPQQLQDALKRPIIGKPLSPTQKVFANTQARNVKSSVMQLPKKPVSIKSVGTKPNIRQYVSQSKPITIRAVSKPTRRMNL